ncbi:hypothetical protein NF418_00820 [Streptococcus suis]|uniref:hypothetical protein n=1 Tax=Streptococcus suis TaxID=1307 RepID=UPI002117AE8A|nr:hypothetical protein [Streptococcus suis]
MKAKFIGETTNYTLDNGKIYDILTVEGKFFRVIDKSGEDYLYLAENFEIVEH